MKHNAIALILDPHDDAMQVVQKFWTLPKDKTHIMLFSKNTRHCAFVDWKFSQCGYRTRFILPPNDNDEWELAKIQQWISDKKWLPSNYRILITHSKNVINTFNDEMNAHMKCQPIYCNDVHIIV